MTADAIRTRKLIAMAMFAGDDWRADYEGTPPIMPYVCVGYIARHERLTDGRYNILLHGACRARIAEELEHAPYRTAILQPSESESLMDIDLEDHRARIERLLHDPELMKLSSVNAIQNWLSDESPTAAVIDLAVMSICDQNEQRYAMLAECDVSRRANWLESTLEQTRHSLLLAARHESGARRDGFNVN